MKKSLSQTPWLFTLIGIILLLGTTLDAQQPESNGTAVNGVTYVQQPLCQSWWYQHPALSVARPLRFTRTYTPFQFCFGNCAFYTDGEDGDQAEDFSNAYMMSIESKPFGETKEGDAVTAWTLQNENGLTATILDFGGLLYEMNTPDKDGRFDNISCNYATIPEYQDIRPYFGSLVGRYANRIAKGQFTLDGVQYQVPVNDGDNALHGGLKGFDQVIWNVEPFSTTEVVGLRLTYCAADGEEGYPGQLNIVATYTLNNDNELVIDYEATTDKATPVNLTNHTFWNLGGATSGSILDTELTMNAPNYLPTDGGLIPTGEIGDVTGTPLDFRQTKTIGRDIQQITEPQFNGGYDHCFILEAKDPGAISFCARARDPKTGRTLEITTTEPAVQFYSGNFLDGSTGVGDYRYEKQSAFCLETQHYPDSPNHDNFPNTILRPGETYRHTTIHKFGVEK